MTQKESGASISVQQMYQLLLKLDDRLDRIEQDLTVIKTKTPMLQAEIEKVDTTFQQKVKDIKNRLWAFLIFATGTAITVIQFLLK